MKKILLCVCVVSILILSSFLGAYELQTSRVLEHPRFEDIQETHKLHIAVPSYESLLLYDSISPEILTYGPPLFIADRGQSIVKRDTMAGGGQKQEPIKKIEYQGDMLAPYGIAVQVPRYFVFSHGLIVAPDVSSMQNVLLANIPKDLPRDITGNTIENSIDEQKIEDKPHILYELTKVRLTNEDIGFSKLIFVGLVVENEHYTGLATASATATTATKTVGDTAVSTGATIDAEKSLLFWGTLDELEQGIFPKAHIVDLRLEHHVSLRTVARFGIYFLHKQDLWLLRDVQKEPVLERIDEQVYDFQVVGTDEYHVLLVEKRDGAYLQYNTKQGMQKDEQEGSHEGIQRRFLSATFSQQYSMYQLVMDSAQKSLYVFDTSEARPNLIFSSRFTYQDDSL